MLVDKANRTCKST